MPITSLNDTVFLPASVLARAPFLAAGLVTAAGMWWIYFSREQHHHITTLRSSLVFGYFYYFIFAAAGIEIAIGSISG